MDFVVLGAGGFLGRALRARLEARGRRVLSVGRGDPLPPAPGAVCVHLAGFSVASRAADPKARIEAIELARRTLSAGWKRVVFASSAAVYGDAAATPRKESDSLAPRGAYAELKAELEGLFAGPHAIARLANCYGPGQSQENLISDILRQLPGDGVVRLKGAADSVRDYLHADDAAEGLAALAESSESGAFNLGTGVGHDAASVARLLGARKVEAGTPSGSRLVLDCDKARRLLGWSARVSLAEGVKSLLAGRAS